MHTLFPARPHAHALALLCHTGMSSPALPYAHALSQSSARARFGACARALKCLLKRALTCVPTLAPACSPAGPCARL
eukprot:5599632-Pleurochrysis_carterae.AAC.1